MCTNVRDEEERLIDLVRSHPNLYDKSHPEYKNLLSRESNWKEIGEGLNMCAKEILMRWEKLRKQYMGYLRRLKKPSGSGTGVKPYFRHEKALAFLKDAPELNERTISNLEIEGGNENGTESQNHAVMFELSELQDVGLEMSDCEDFGRTPTSSTSKQTLYPRSQVEAKFRSHEKGNKRKMTEFEHEVLSEFHKNKRHEDEFDHFADMLAQKLRSISKDNRARFLTLQHEMMGLMLKAEMESINEKSN